MQYYGSILSLEELFQFHAEDYVVTGMVHSTLSATEGRYGVGGRHYSYCGRTILGHIELIVY